MCRQGIWEPILITPSRLILNHFRPLILAVQSFEMFERQLLISIVSGFPKALEGYAMYNTWKQEICSHTFPTDFFRNRYSSLVRGTLCKSCSASYNIAINIANNNFHTCSKTLKVSCFLSKWVSQFFSGDEIVHFIPVSLKEITDRSFLLVESAVQTKFIKRNLLSMKNIVSSSISYRMM